MTLEATIQRNIIVALRARGAYVAKFSAGDIGTPDLLCCYKGLFVGLECKQPGNYPTRIQRHRMEQITAAGGIARVVRSVAEALAVLEEIDMERPSPPSEDKVERG